MKNEKGSTHDGPAELTRKLGFYPDDYPGFKVFRREGMRSTCISDKSFWYVCVVEINGAGGREISWLAFPVIWMRENFLLLEYLSNSAVRLGEY